MSRVSPATAFSQLGVRDAGGIDSLERRRLRVIRDRRQAEPNRRLVALVVSGDTGEQPRRLAARDDEHARRHRIERAAVADLARAEQPPHACNDVVGRRACRLVDDDDPDGSSVILVRVLVWVCVASVLRVFPQLGQFRVAHRRLVQRLVEVAAVSGSASR